jgi:integral membrane protein (TIGR01906 family)
MAARILLGVATAIVIIALAILPFLTPAWMSFAQTRAEAHAWTGYPEPELRRVTSSIVSDLVFGPPAFDVSVDGRPVLNEREQSHMRDVRTVMLGLWLLAIVSAGVLVAGWLAARRQRAYWSAIRGGGVVLAATVVLIGVFALVAFDVLFELFHRIFFPAGTYTFDPATERLVQLFPYRFWIETAFAAGTLIVAGGLAVGWLAGRRRGSLQRTSRGVHSPAGQAAR